MNFANPVILFQHLLSLSEEKLEENFNLTIKPEDLFYEEVKTLITAHKANQEQTLFQALINEKAATLVDDNIIHQLEGKQLGYYQLTKKIGQGGMGVVYLAQRNDAQLEQKVAIKFVFPSIAALAGEDFLRKEAQHLANLEHQNIARIYTVDNYQIDESGESGESQLTTIPYMIMEYIDGSPIDQYCDDNNLNLTQRLKLFQQVCDAVHTAHQNMILHADIKPSNILVDKQGVPKLMDFGIACSLDENDDKAKKNHLNAASSDYASPEQLKGERLTAASDVYSLGKLLKHIIKKPNKEFLSIIQCASQSDRNKRYQSALQLAQDLKDYTENKPLKNHKAFLYRPYKFIFRNKLSSTLLLGFVISSTLFTTQTYKQNQVLEKEKLISDKVTTFIIESFKAANPENAENAEKENTTALDILNKAEKSLSTIDDLTPEIKGKIFYYFAKAYSGAGEIQASTNILNKIVDYPNQNKTKIYLQIASNLNKKSQYKEALKSVNQAISNEKKGSLLYGKALAQKGSILMMLDKHKEALALFKLSVSIIINKKSALDPNLPTIYNQIANIYSNMGDFEKEMEYATLTYNITEKIYGSSSPQMSNALLSMAHAYSVAENYEQYAKLTKQALEIDKKIYGKEHPRVIIISNNLGNAYSKLGKYTAAVKIHKEAIAATLKAFGKNHIDYAYGNSYLGNVLSRMHKYSEALIAYKESYESSRAVFGESHHVTVTAQKNLGESYLENGQPLLANKMLISALKKANDIYEKGHPRLAMVKLAAAKTYKGVGQYKKALQLAKEALVVFKTKYPDDGEFITDTNKQISALISLLKK